MKLNTQNLYEEFQKYSFCVNPFGAMVQCYHETFYQGKEFNSELCIKANNLAGIKQGSGWAGALYNKSSWEQKSTGEKYEKISSFRAYPSWKDFCKDYAINKIGNDYPLSAASADNFIGYYCGLFKGKWGKWATDLAYLEKLLSYTKRLAPLFFNPWEQKICDAVIFAKYNNRILSDEQMIIIDNWMKTI